MEELRALKDVVKSFLYEDDPVKVYIGFRFAFV